MFNLAVRPNLMKGTGCPDITVMSHSETVFRIIFFMEQSRLVCFWVTRKI